MFYRLVFPLFGFFPAMIGYSLIYLILRNDNRGITIALLWIGIIGTALIQYGLAWRYKQTKNELLAQHIRTTRIAAVIAFLFAGLITFLIMV